jgi:hypothetical protein
MTKEQALERLRSRCSRAEYCSGQIAETLRRWIGRGTGRLPVASVAEGEALQLCESDIPGIISQLKAEKFDEEVKAITGKYETMYASGAAAYTVDFKNIEYNSKYSFITDSYATAEDYIKTDYTSDVGNIALITYSNGTDTVQFILNYNIYTVTVNLDGTLLEVGKFGYTRIG